MKLILLIEMLRYLCTSLNLDEMIVFQKSLSFIGYTLINQIRNVVLWKQKTF